MRAIRSSLLLFLVAVAGFASVVGLRSLAKFGLLGNRGARVYYDAYHGARHLWNRENRRHRHAYNTVSGYARFVRELRESGYVVDVHDRTGIESASLARYDVLFVGEQTYDGRFMTDVERDELLAWVRDGGSLFTIVEHTNAYYMGDVFNRLFAELPVKARFDTISDAKQPAGGSVDWVNVRGDGEGAHPIARGVREFLMYAGASLDTPHGVMHSGPTSWGDGWQEGKSPVHNGNMRRDEGEREGPLAGVAAFEYGRGKVIVMGDHNAFSNPNIHYGDHERFLHNAFDWLVRDRVNTDVYWLAAGLFLLLGTFALRKRGGVPRLGMVGTMGVGMFVGLYWGPGQDGNYHDVFVHAGNQATMNYMTKDKGGYLTLYGQWTKEPQLRPRASRLRIESGHDALILSSPTQAYDADQIEVIDDYLDRGKTVVYLASARSLESPAGKQLAEKFGYRVHVDRRWPLPKKGRAGYLPHGPEELLAGIPRFHVRKRTYPVVVERGLEPIVHLTPGGRYVQDRRWTQRGCVFDLMSEKRVGLGGRFVLLAPIEMFDTGGLGGLYEVRGLVPDQMAEFMIRVVKYSVGDETVVGDDETP